MLVLRVDNVDEQVIRLVHGIFIEKYRQRIVAIIYQQK